MFPFSLSFFILFGLVFTLEYPIWTKCTHTSAYETHAGLAFPHLIILLSLISYELDASEQNEPEEISMIAHRIAAIASQVLQNCTLSLKFVPSVDASRTFSLFSESVLLYPLLAGYSRTPRLGSCKWDEHKSRLSK